MNCSAGSSLSPALENKQRLMLFSEHCVKTEIYLYPLSASCIRTVSIVASGTCLMMSSERAWAEHKDLACWWIRAGWGPWGASSTSSAPLISRIERWCINIQLDFVEDGATRHSKPASRADCATLVPRCWPFRTRSVMACRTWIIAV